MSRARLVAAVAAAVLLLGGCSADPLAEQYREGSGKGYIAGDGSVTQLPDDQRGTPVSFSGEGENGELIDSEELVGEVVVVNFWYAACAPCRAEAPDLQALHEEFADQGVRFVGVNVRDQAANARAFAETYGITYPSIIDVNSGSAKLAFSGDVPPNAVPTTIVLDAEGRVAARVLGRIDRSILSTLIKDTLDSPAAAATAAADSS